MSIDCQHWVPFLLAAERHEKAALERENRRLKRTLADIHDLTRNAERPEPDWSSLAMQRRQRTAVGQQSLRPQQGVFGDLLGGAGWPWL